LGQSNGSVVDTPVSNAQHPHWACATQTNTGHSPSNSSWRGAPHTLSASGVVLGQVFQRGRCQCHQCNIYRSPKPESEGPHNTESDPEHNPTERNNVPACNKNSTTKLILQTQTGAGGLGPHFVGNPVTTTAQTTQGALGPNRAGNTYTPTLQALWAEGGADCVGLK